MRRLIATCSVALLAVALFGACGSSSSKTGSSNTSDTKASTGNGSSSNDDFSKLIADASKERFKITYTTDNGDQEQTYAQDGHGNSVYGSSDSQYFTSADGSVTCDTNSDGKATCTKVPGTGSISPFLTLFQSGKAAINVLGGRYGDTSSKTIAGRDAKCLTISIGASATYCIDKDTGVMLEFSAKTGSTEKSVFLVTKFETPTDSDFTPPATPETIPSIPDVSIPTITYPPGYTGPTIPGP